MHELGGGCYSSVLPTSPVQAVALDIQAAYDSVWKVGLLEKLVAKGVSGTLISWIQSFLSGRHNILQIGVSRVEVASECGVP